MQKTFFGRYHLTAAYDGSPEEIGRSGPAISYKARDTRENEPVAVQIIPIASIDPTARELFEERAGAALKLDHLNIAKVLAVGAEDDSLVLASEYLEGETADSWLAKHGPMPADAVLRVGLQVVRALGAAAYHGLTHRAIQPSNILLLPGQTAEGGWPLIKLLNFGLAGQEVHSNETSVRALAPPIAPQFASPEQLVNKPVDFRSEIYSLGTTMCFLLTGAVPLAGGGMKARLRARRLPELRRAPRSLRRLLLHMLRERPENRPNDPIAFEAEMRECLTRIERRQALGRKLGLPLGGVVPRPTPRPATSSVGRQIALGFATVAALLLTGAVVAAFLLPADAVPFLRHKTDAKLVGIPDASPRIASSSPAQNQPMTTASQPPAIPQTQPAQPINAPSAAATASPVQVASAEQQQSAAVQPQPPPEENQAPPQPQRTVAAKEPSAPAQGPDESSGTPTNASSAKIASNSATKPRQSNETTSTDADQTESAPSPPPKQPAVVADRKAAATKPPRFDRAHPNELDQAGRQRVGRGRVRAQVVGFTADGRLVLRLPSGRIVTAAPNQVVQPPHRVMTSRQFPPDEIPPEREGPYQPFNQNLRGPANPNYNPDYPFGD